MFQDTQKLADDASPRAWTEARREASGSFTLSALGLLAAVVILLGPIYWLPGVPPQPLGLLKDLFLVVFLYCALFKQLLVGRNPFAYLFSYEGGALALCIAFAFLGVLSSEQQTASLILWLRYLGAVMIVCAAYNLFSERPALMFWMERVFLIPIFLCVAYILLTQFGFLPMLKPPSEFSLGTSDIFTYNTMGFSFRRNAMSRSIALVWPICFYYFIRMPAGQELRVRRLIWGALCAALFFAMIITQGRGGLSQVLIVSAIGLLLVNFRTKLVAFVAVLCFIPGILLLNTSNESLVASYTKLLTRQFGPSKNRITADRLSSGRVQNYVSSLELIQENPLTGIGLGQYANIVDNPKKQASFVHNLYLALATEAGIASSLAAVAFMGLVLVRWTLFVARRRDELNNHVFIWHAILILNFLDTLFEQGTMFNAIHSALPFWFALAALNVYQRQYALTSSSPAPMEYAETPAQIRAL